MNNTVLVVKNTGHESTRHTEQRDLQQTDAKEWKTEWENLPYRPLKQPDTLFELAKIKNKKLLI